MTQKLCLLIIGVLFATMIMAQKCPAPGEGFGVCIEACTNDSDCKTGQLCCSNGCGHECMSPVDRCATVRCAAPKCHELSAGTITPEGKCCPVCACAATDGSMVPAGTSFMNDCNRCSCGSNGLAACTLRACPPTPPSPPPTPPSPPTASTPPSPSPTPSSQPPTPSSQPPTPPSQPSTPPTTTTTTDATLPTSSPTVKCPNTTGLFGTCDEKCSGDDECSNGQLCCSNGCGHDCMDPVVDCAAVLCLQPNCTSLSVPVTPKGSCCPVCGCRTPNGGRVAPGETYRPDSCNTCICFQNGLAACTEAFCPPTTNSTPTPTTDKSTATPSVTPTEPSQTCPTVPSTKEENCVDECSSDDDCQYERICCSNGCGGRVCSDSVEMCRLIFCAIPICEDEAQPVTSPFSCCPFCPPTTATQNCSVTEVTGRVSHNRRRQRTRLTFSSDDDQRVTYICKLDDERSKKCTSPMVWRNLKRGRHTITVRAFCSDDEGNRTTSARRKFRVRVR